MQRVVRAGPGLGVVLDGARRHVAQHQALDRAVVEVDLRQLGGAEVGLPAHRLVGVDRLLAVRADDREAVVLARDVDPAGLEVLDRVVGAAVAERELGRLQADGAAEQLVAEADAEHRQLADQLADRVDDVAERRRVAGAVGEEDGVGVAGQQVAPRDVVQGCSSTRAPRSRRLRTIESLMPGVDRGDRRAGVVAVSGSSMTGSAGVTSRARSAPAIGGSASTRSIASLSAARPGRRRRASRPGRGCGARARACRRRRSPGRRSRRARSASRPRRAGASSRSIPSRITTARAWTESDSMFSAATP